MADRKVKYFSYLFNLILIGITIFQHFRSSSQISQLMLQNNQLLQTNNQLLQTNEKLFSKIGELIDSLEIVKKLINQNKSHLAESKVSQILKEGTGRYYVIIGYCRTEQEALKLVDVAKGQGFTNAKAHLPYKGSPYYGISAGSNLSWEQANALLKEARRYYSTAWIWQPHD